MADSAVDHRLLAGAQRILAAKLAISESLPSGSFHDPALVLMLQLFAQPGRGAIERRVLCDCVPGVSLSVCARWVAVLEDDGIVRTAASSIGEGGEIVSALIVAVGGAEKRR